MHRRLVLPVLGALLLGFAHGCGAPTDRLTPVEGRVSYRGSPLRGGHILFTPDTTRGNQGPQAWGDVGADGRFQLQTDGSPGAAPGWYRITLVAETGPGERSALPAQFADPELSGLTREIVKGQPNQLELNLP